MRAPLVLALLGACAIAAPEREELIREEAHNFRILGAKLPAGWKKAPKDLSWSYAIDGIDHAFGQLHVERLAGDVVDVEAELRKREHHYVFPASPAGSEGTIARARWGGRDAFVWSFETKIRKVVCKRRVYAFSAKSLWYEYIETVWGADTESDDRCAEGLATLRVGMRLLAPPLPKSELGRDGDPEIVDKDLGFEITRPETFDRVDVDTAADPGCRVAFEGRAADPTKRAYVRLFEYGIYDAFDASLWLDTFFGTFSSAYTGAKQEDVKPPPIVSGSSRVVARRFSGLRDGVPVETTVVIAQSDRTGRVFALRLRRSGDSAPEFHIPLRKTLESLRLP